MRRVAAGPRGVPKGLLRLAEAFMASREVFHFEDFTLDVGERRLLRGTETVRLSPKAYDLLVALVRQAGRLAKKDELLARWRICPTDVADKAETKAIANFKSIYGGRRPYANLAK